MSSKLPPSEEVEFSFGSDPDGEILFERFCGRMTPACFLEAFRSDALRSHYRPGIKIITDFRDALVDIRYSEMRTFVEEMKVLFGSGGGIHGRAAMIVGSDASFGVSRMYEALTESAQSPDVRVFRDWEDAVDWLETSEHAIDAAKTRAVTIKLPTTAKAEA